MRGRLDGVGLVGGSSTVRTREKERIKSKKKVVVVGKERLERRRLRTWWRLLGL